MRAAVKNQIANWRFNGMPTNVAKFSALERTLLGMLEPFKSELLDAFRNVRNRDQLSVADVIRLAGSESAAQGDWGPTLSELAAKVIDDLAAARAREGARLATMLVDRVSQLRKLAQQAGPAENQTPQVMPTSELSPSMNRYALGFTGSR